MTDQQRANLTIRFEALIEKLRSEAATEYGKSIANALDKIIASFVTSTDITDWQRRKHLTKIIKEELNTTYDTLMDGVLSEMAAITIPTSLFVSSLYLDTPIDKAMKFTGDTLIHGYELRDLIRSNEEHHIRAFKVYIANGLTLGESPQKVHNEMKKFNDGKIKHIEEKFVRNVMRVARRDAKIDTFKELERLGAVKSFIFHATLDSHTTYGCAQRDGKRYKTIESVPAGDMPPRHWNCLTGDTLVSTRYPVSNIFRRSYKGRIYTIHTAGGNEIRVTPNHPILTDKGFVPADSINEGDKIVSDSRSEGLLFSDIQDNKGISTIEDLFRSLSKSSLVRSEKVPLSPEDFHGDASIDDEVDIISIDSLLFDNISKGKRGNNHILFRGHFYIERLFSRISHFFNGLITRNSSKGGFMARLNLLSPLRVVHKFPFSGLLLRLISYFYPLSNKLGLEDAKRNVKPLTYPTETNSVIVEGNGDLEAYNPIVPPIEVEGDSSTVNNHPTDWLGTHPQLSSDITSGALGDKVFLDDVINISIAENVSCHVYNLENDMGYYTANNLITHNCRSVITPNGSGKYGRAGWDYNQDAGTTYEYGMKYHEWLKLQPKDVQYAIKSRHALEMRQIERLMKK